MAFQGDSIFWVEVEKIVPNPFQPRREFDEDRLKELAESIRMYGVLQPLTVTRKEVYGEDGSFKTEYELIAGERRLRASQLAGLEQVPVIIRSGEQTEQEKLELAIIENLQREDLNAVDRALAFKQLADAFNLSHGDVAKKVGRSREYVSNSIRLLSLPENILQSLKRGEISEGHARTLLMLKDKPEEQDVVYREILLKKLSVREVERISRKIAADKVRKREWANTDAHLIEMERAFTDTLGTRVQISKTDFGGKLTIDYFSEHDLEKLLETIKTQGEGWLVTTETALTQGAAPASTEPVVRTMDEVTTPLHEIIDATPLEIAADANDREHQELGIPVIPQSEPEPILSVEHVEPPMIQEVPSVPRTYEPSVVPVATPEMQPQSSPVSVPLEQPVAAPAPWGSVAHRATPQFGSAVSAPTTPIAPVTPEQLTPVRKEEPVVPIVPIFGAPTSDSAAPETKSNDDSNEDGLYSVRNFSL